MSGATYGEFRATGRSDAYNSYSADEFDMRIGEDLPHPDRARAIVLAYAREHLPANDTSWIDSQDADTFGDLSPYACYAAWRACWLIAAFEITLDLLRSTP